MHGMYILDPKTKLTYKVDDIIEWSMMSSGWEDKIVAKTDIGEIHISTVFLGLDHSWHGDSKPILFETMIFGGEFDGWQRRYETWDQALEGHHQVCEMVVNV